MNEPFDHVIVIFGAAGDLAKKKLVPAFHRLWSGGLMAERWRIVGTGRSERSDEEFRGIAREAVQEAVGDLGDWERFGGRLSYTPANFGPGRTEALAAAVADARQAVGGDPETLVYLSTPPSTYHDISAGLVESGMVARGRVVFKAPPREMFPGGLADGGLDPNRLMLDRDRPGCLKLGLMTKESGWDMSLQASTLGLDGAVEDVGVGPYERLLHDALLGDRTLFTSIDAVDRAWQIVEPVLSDPPPLHPYEQKGWGPIEADRLIAPHAWALSPARTR